MKRLIFLLTVFMLLACGAAGADPAKTDGTVTAWIGEDNNYYMILADGQPRRLTAPMKDILTIDETDVTALTQDGQLITVKKDGSSFSQLWLNATEEAIAPRGTGPSSWKKESCPSVKLSTRKGLPPR